MLAIKTVQKKQTTTKKVAVFIKNADAQWGKKKRQSLKY